MSSERIEEAISKLWRDGVCMLAEAIDPAILSTGLSALRAARPDFFEPDQAPEKLFVSSGRFFAALEIAGVFGQRSLLLPAAVEQVLSASLGDDFVFDSWGVINALPGAEEQHWHRDGGILFPSNPLEFMLPASAVTLAIPFVEMNGETGTTGFSLRSHRAPEHAEVPDHEPQVAVGSALLWDYRVFHKGMANRSDRARPLVYATFCRPWWTDPINHGEQARLIAEKGAFDAMEPDLRRRLRRAHVADQ